MNCGTCDKPLGKKNVSGYCRFHSAAGLNSDPVRKALKYARRSATMSAPDRRARMIAHLGRISADKVRGWCPPEYVDEYFRLNRKKGLTAPEAKAVILKLAAAAERKRLAAMTPFERSMERIRMGAGITTKPDLRKADPAFTLGGIASGAL